MAEGKDNTKKKKTLSLKLGTKPLIAPKKNIEAGKTVIVEKKRYKRAQSSDSQSLKTAPEAKSPVEKKIIETNQKNINKSGVVLKPLSRDQQKRILKADTKKEKKDEIEKIRFGKASNIINQQNNPTVVDTNVRFENVDNREIKKDTEKKKNSETTHEVDDRKKTQNTFGRKKIR